MKWLIFIALLVVWAASCCLGCAEPHETILPDKGVVQIWWSETKTGKTEVKIMLHPDIIHLKDVIRSAYDHRKNSH